MDELIEDMARALCEQHIRVVRRWDTTPEKLEEMMSRAVDHAWPDHEPAARAALAAIHARGDRVVPASSSTNFRLTDEQKTLFDAAASITGETRSSWTRRTLIEAARKATKEK
jgi:hypothetical protein